MKVLWIGDAVVNSGFSVVTHNICNSLHKKCDLEVFGIRYKKEMPNPYPYKIYPGFTDTDIYGFSYARKVIEDTSPDIIVVFNDDHIVERYISPLYGGNARIVPLFPINMLPLDTERMLGFSVPSYNIAGVMTYTNFSKGEILKINPNLNTTAIYHGVDTMTFKPLPDVKSQFGLKNNFVVGTVGTNTYRKRLDLFLRGFAEFAKDKSDAKCLVHATNLDMAYDLPFTAKNLGIQGKTILSQKPKDFPDMNVLYNLMHVNVNTSLGEGFGLPLVEGAAAGVPVLCPAHGNLIDIWGEDATYIDLKDDEYVAGTKYIGGVIDIKDMVSKLNMFYENRTKLEDMGTRALDRANTEQFSWEHIADKVYEFILNANKGRISYVD
jgi:glycosyltransferase involved in cell wall biosynthesis